MQNLKAERQQSQMTKQHDRAQVVGNHEKAAKIGINHAALSPLIIGKDFKGVVKAMYLKEFEIAEKSKRELMELSRNGGVI
jgi:hypothetical protein